MSQSKKTPGIISGALMSVVMSKAEICVLNANTVEEKWFSSSPVEIWKAY